MKGCSPAVEMDALLLAQTIVSDSASYAVGWFTLSVINAGLAQSKNRSGLGWWIGSLFLGPLCTVLVVLLDRLPPTPMHP
jgi:hypothetical protein